MKINRRQLRRLINEVIQEGLTAQHSYKDPHDPDVAYTGYNQREVGRINIKEYALNNFRQYAEMNEMEEGIHFKVEQDSGDTVTIIFMDIDAAKEAEKYYFAGTPVDLEYAGASEPMEIDPLSSRTSDVIKKMTSPYGSPTGIGKLRMK